MQIFFAFSEVIAYIEDVDTSESTTSAFKLSDLTKQQVDYYCCYLLFYSHRLLITLVYTWNGGQQNAFATYQCMLSAVAVHDGALWVPGFF